MSIRDSGINRKLAAFVLALIMASPLQSQAPYVPDVTEAREKEWRTLVAAAQSSYASGKLSEGVEPARRAATLAEELFGPDDPRTLISVNDLALHLEAVGHYAETEALMRRVFDSYNRTRGEDDPNTQVALENLVDFYVARKRPDVAGPLAGYALDSFRRTTGAASERSKRMERIVAALPAPADAAVPQDKIVNETGGKGSASQAVQISTGPPEGEKSSDIERQPD